MHRLQNGTFKVLGVACVLAGAVFAWGQSYSTLQDHERRLLGIETKIGCIHTLVVKMAAIQGIDDDCGKRE